MTILRRRKGKGRVYSPARARAARKRLAARGVRWTHAGGGTWLLPLPGRKRFPCDDTYENVVTGEMVEFYTTREAHFVSLRKLKDIKTLRSITAVPGVKLHRRWMPE